MTSKITLIATAFTLTFATLPVQAQNMSDADRQKLIENMSQADRNEDGALTRAEFETLINLNAEDGLGKAAMVQRAGLYDKAFKRLDQNGDGSLTPQEMKTFAGQAKG